MGLITGGAYKTKWEEISENAHTWGSGLCKSIKNGMENGKKWVQEGVTNVAEKIRRNPHFSKPDEGPWSILILICRT